MSYGKCEQYCPICGDSSCQEGCAAAGHDTGRRDRELALAEVIDELLARERPTRVASSELTEDGRVEVLTSKLPRRRFFVTVEEDADELGRV